MGDRRVYAMIGGLDKVIGSEGGRQQRRSKKRDGCGEEETHKARTIVANPVRMRAK